MIHVEGLGLKHAVGLLALGRACASEDFSRIYPISSVSERLTPTWEYDFDLLVEMCRRGVIAVDPEFSTLEAFEFEQDSENGAAKVASYYPTQVAWRLLEHSLVQDGTSLQERLTDTAEVFQELEEIFDSSSPWPPLWAIMWEEDNWRKLWKEISLQECLAYLRLVLGEHSLPFKPGDKTRFVIGNVLENFSVAQVWSLIWRAGRDAAAFYMREGSTRSHAANTVVGSIQRQAERVTADNWDLKGFRRNWKVPRSIVSEVFFGRALRIGDKGVTCVIPPEGTDLENFPNILGEVS